MPHLYYNSSMNELVVNLLYTFSSILAVMFVFLFAIEKFSKQIQYLAGDKFKRGIERLTSTPLKGTIVGTGITAIMQSSTAVSVMAISLVEGGLLSFTNSLGIIYGANIGTTITTSLIAFQLLEIAPFILMLGFLLMKIDSRYKHFGKSIFYFGLIFSSLFIIAVLVEPLKNNPLIVSILEHTSGIFFSIIVGIVLSTLLQASSVVSGLAIIMAGAGLMGFEQSFAIILGANIGTTTTGLIASLVVGKNAKRVAMAHFLFNVLGVVLLLPFFSYFATFMQSLADSIELQVAFAHVIFNILSALVALVFTKQFEWLVVKTIK